MVAEKYFRYMVPSEAHHDTLEEAMRAAWLGCEHNTHYTELIIDTDGTIYDRMAINTYWAKKGWAFTLDTAIGELVMAADSLEEDVTE